MLGILGFPSITMIIIIILMLLKGLYRRDIQIVWKAKEVSRMMSSLSVASSSTLFDCPFCK